MKLILYQIIVVIVYLEKIKNRDSILALSKPIFIFRAGLNSLKYLISFYLFIFFGRSE